MPGSLVSCESCSLNMTLGVVLTPETMVAGKLAASASSTSAPQGEAPAQSKRTREYHKLKTQPFQTEFTNREASAATLAEWLDCSADEILVALTQLDDGSAYELWRIPKGKGKFREISSPSDELKAVQRRVLDRLLYRVPCSNAAHGFMPGRSIVTGAKVHLSTATEVFNVDLKDAFPSVKAERVKHLFVRHVKVPFLHLGRFTGYEQANDLINMLTRLVTWQGQLPQGAPTSGCLLNIACTTLDKRIFRLLDEAPGQYRYTRFADDLTISSGHQMPRVLRHALMKVITNSGFETNVEKTKYLRISAGQTLEVTGLHLEKGKVRIPREKLDRYRAKIHNASQIPLGELTDEVRLDTQSTAAFVAMVYERLPNKILKPYLEFCEAHGLRKPWQNKPTMPFFMYPSANNADE